MNSERLCLLLRAPVMLMAMGKYQEPNGCYFSSVLYLNLRLTPPLLPSTHAAPRRRNFSVTVM